MHVVLERVIPGGVLGGVLSLTQNAAGQGSITLGIIVFAVGIVVGLSCVTAMNYLVQQRQRHDFDLWVASGRPERRDGDERRDGERRNGA